MDTQVIDLTPANCGLAPFSLKDAPTLIESIFPAQKVGIEAQKERKAGPGQTLTALGSYWKGRKPLVLVRACVLASLLPATGDPDGDLELFEALMAMDDQAMLRRQPSVDAGHVWASSAISQAEKDVYIEVVADKLNDNNVEGEKEKDVPRRATKVKWRRLETDHLQIPIARRKLRERVEAERENLKAIALSALPFAEQVALCERTEKVENIQNANDPVYAGVWKKVNARLGTTSLTIPELVEQLGIARFGHRTIVGDPFAGGGSVPFEAARIGCDVVASDLNPMAVMLTWGALNIIGADAPTRKSIALEQRRVAAAVDAEITRLGIEHNEHGDRAKSYMYCMEVVDPRTGWRIPMTSSWVISRNRRCVARPVPDHARKRFDILVEEGVSTEALKQADLGTVRDGHLIYRVSPIPDGEEQEWRIPISRLRGDGEGSAKAGRGQGNRLRSWNITDVVPHEPDWIPDAAPILQGSLPGAWIGGDIWLERLYAIQWIDGDDIKEGKARPRAWFAAPTTADLKREAAVLRLVEQNLFDWQKRGLVPDMVIEAGEKTDEPIRTRGWTHWHHLFAPRHLLLLAILSELTVKPETVFALGSLLDRTSRLTRWHVGMVAQSGVAGSGDKIENVFYNQAFNTNVSYGARAWCDLEDYVSGQVPSFELLTSR